MAMITMTGLSHELTEDERKELDALEGREIIYDDDSPRMTEKMLSQFHRFSTIPIAIDSSNYDIIRSFGKDYQGILSQLLNLALKDANMVQKVFS